MDIKNYQVEESTFLYYFASWRAMVVELIIRTKRFDIVYFNNFICHLWGKNGV